MTIIHFDQNGIARGVRFIHTPNCGSRPEGSPVELVVLHNISLPPREFGGNGVIELFTNHLDANAHPYYREICRIRVSAHFFIRRNGELIQFVPCTQRAWHAGVSCWQGRENCNDFSIGIELEGSDFEAFEAAQYKVLNTLLTAIGQTYPISGIVGHSDISPGRKTDPGPFFDWERINSNPP